jgi:hypothetical protein
VAAVAAQSDRVGRGCGRALRREWPPDQPLVLDDEAAVHHHHQARRSGDPRRLLADHPQLEPQRSRADLRRGAGDLGRRLGTPEHVDQVDAARDNPEVGEARLSEHLPLVRIDRDHGVALFEQLAHHPVARPLDAGRRPDQGDHRMRDQQIPQDPVGWAHRLGAHRRDRTSGGLTLSRNGGVAGGACRDRDQGVMDCTACTWDLLAHHGT